MLDDAMPRVSAVAGRFYPASASRLQSLLTTMLETTESALPTPLLMAPHAGYVYSGRIAAATYARTLIPEQVLLLGPNHTGMGADRSLYNGGPWQTPLGDVPVARDLYRCLLDHVDVTPDRVAHVSEHALEVQLPFLKLRQPSVSIAALCFAYQSLSDCADLGEQIATALDNFQRPVLLVCSSDMSHYISAAVAQRLDSLALACIESLEPESLYRTVVQHRISMCGFVPTTIGLIAAKRRGAKQGRIVAYGNSGETSGDFERVVGYAGALVS